MPSPFPGMDPWLERRGLFPDFHNTMIVMIRAALGAALPDGYVATSANRVWIDDELRRDPDVSLFGPDSPSHPLGGSPTPFAAAGMLAVAAAKMSEPLQQPYLEILSDDGERLVTAVEIVSPSNKTVGRGRVSYLQKQGEFESAGVNLVEIDLLRAGPHTTAVPERGFRHAVGVCEYHACVTAWDSATRKLVHHVAPIGLLDRLPVLPVPLDFGIAPVQLNLQAAFTRAYDEGRFDKLAKYHRPCDPPLTPEQQAWASGILNPGAT